MSFYKIKKQDGGLTNVSFNFWQKSGWEGDILGNAGDVKIMGGIKKCNLHFFNIFF